MIKTISVCLLALAAVAGPEPLRAQYTSPGGVKWDNPYGAALDSSLTFAVQKGIFARRERRATAEPILCFKPAAKPIAVEAIARHLGRTDQERKLLAEAFVGILRASEEEFRKDPDDRDPHDLAKAYAFFIVANYAVLHPGADLDSGVMKNLTDQFRTALMDSPEAKKATDAAKQSVWESLIIFAGFAGGGYTRAIQEHDKETAEAMRKMARESLRALLKADPDEVVLLEGKMCPLSFTPKPKPVQPDVRGELRVGWLVFKLPKGWKAEKGGQRLVLTPGDLKAGETLTVVAAPAEDEAKWYNAEYFAWRAVTGKEIWDDAVKFPDPVSKSSILANGWSARVQVGKLTRGGWATVLILQLNPKEPILFVLTSGSGADVVNRYNQQVTDLFTRQARQYQERQDVGKSSPGAGSTR